jgi:hypothetical protein
MTPAIDAIFARQDQLITRRQALRHVTEDEVAARLGRRWQVVLPGVYASFTGALSPRQRLRAALLAAGDDAVLNDLDALRAHGVPYLPPEPLVRLLVPDTVHRTSRQFIVIRRTTRMPPAVIVDGFRVAPAARATCEFAARHPDERESLAVVAAAVQLGKVSVEQLVAETRLGPARGRPRLVRMIGVLGDGIRSAPEDDFRRLVARSKVLPPPLWNPRVRLPSGRKVHPDALFVDAALVHETNGRDVHAGFEDFQDMQRRHDEMTAAGLTVLHNAPRRLREDGPSVLAEVEQCYARLDRRGLPPGVSLVSPSNAALHGESA